jgi:SAM-dependent methyltransferase
MAKEYAPATLRNRDAILTVLKLNLPENGLVLEIASGSGEHAAYFAPRLAGLTWQPSAPNSESRASIRSWAEEIQGDNLLTPVDLDVLVKPWPVLQADAMVCINMIHISPWAVTQSLMAGAARTLRMGGILYLYGPYKIEGEHTSLSNQAFHESLKNRDAQWGIRDLADVINEAETHGLMHTQSVQMPANNQSIIFKQT